MSTSPVILPFPESGICTTTGDGAYYLVRGDFAQIAIVGPMHFTPGDYVDALNELEDSHFVVTENKFMNGRNGNDQEVLRRGYVSILSGR